MARPRRREQRLVPVHHLVTLFVPVLLIGLQVTADRLREPPAEVARVNTVVVVIDDAGFRLLGVEDVLVHTRIPCGSGGCGAGDYDFRTLGRYLDHVADAWQRPGRVVVVPAASTSYALTHQAATLLQAQQRQGRFAVVEVAGMRR